MGFYYVLSEVRPRMNDIGLIGLDTSHAEAFADVIEDMDQMAVHGVWDGNDVRSEDYVDSFCGTYDAIRYYSIDELASSVDGLMILTVDWETHAPLASSVLQAGVPTMIDKPVAGSLDNIERIQDNVDGTPIFGGSAVPYHQDFATLPRGGADRTIYAAGYNDFFYYRVHLTDTVRFLADADWLRVAPSEEPGTTVDVTFENGIHATLRFDGSPENGAFGVLDVADATNVVEIDSTQETLSEMYVPFLDRFQTVIAGECDESARIFDSATLLLAVEIAVENHEVVTPASDSLASVRIESSEFVMDYDPYY